jgi:tetratricopeptide (TPR) repeat protein
MKAFGLPAGLLLVVIGTALVAVTHADTLDDARSLMRQGRYDDAIRRLDNHLRTSPDDSSARFLRGVALAEAGRRQEAIDGFSTLVRDFPELPEPHNNLAVLYAAAGNLEKARFHLLEAVRIHPSYATAHENLGDVYGKMAALSFSKALALDGANRSVRAKYMLVEELGGIEGGSRAASSAMTAPAPSLAIAAASSLPTAAPAPSEDIEDRVLVTLRSWADAWSSQDVDAYLGHYSQSFVPAKGRSRESWTILRRKRISAPQFIDLRIVQPRVIRTDDDRASVRFQQSYRSDNYADQTIKRLDLVREGEDWKIISERTEN